MKTYAKIWFLLLLGISVNTYSQNFVGLAKPEVKDLIREKLRGFYEDETIVHKKFNYLKYVDNDGNCTFIFFFNEDDTCTATKMIYDYLYEDEVKASFNKRYTQVDNHTWEFSQKGITYQVNLIKEDWFFTVKTKKKQEN